jgi:hypothetical protein
VFKTFLQHYKLYRYILTQDRVEDRTNQTLTVEPPLILTCFSEGIPKASWDEKERLKEIDEMEDKHRMVILFKYLNLFYICLFIYHQ